MSVCCTEEIASMKSAHSEFITSTVLGWKLPISYNGVLYFGLHFAVCICYSSTVHIYMSKVKKKKKKNLMANKYSIYFTAVIKSIAAITLDIAVIEAVAGMCYYGAYLDFLTACTLEYSALWPSAGFSLTPQKCPVKAP